MDQLYQLDYDFEIMLHKARMSLDKYSEAERFIPLKWMQKLQNETTADFDEARCRNDFMSYLLIALDNNKFEAPFNAAPPDGELKDLVHLLPEMKKIPQVAPENADIFHKSPDGGKFLIRQPVPKSGVFCYMAIVNKPQK